MSPKSCAAAVAVLALTAPLPAHHSFAAEYTLSPNALSRNGWNRNSLQPGEEVTIEGYMAKDGKPLFDGSVHANSRQVIRADGRRVFVGTSADDPQAK
jgi:hypothetical protein